MSAELLAKGSSNIGAKEGWVPTIIDCPGVVVCIDVDVNCFEGDQRGAEEDDEEAW